MPDAHGCPACPHPGTGPAIRGSPDVKVNKRPALRVGDPGIHAACCGPNTWNAQAGAATVFINGKAAHRMNDATKHCGGIGQLIEGSSNVMVGDSSGGGSSGSSSSARGGGGSGSGGGSGGGGSGGAGGGSGGSGSGSGSGGSPDNRSEGSGSGTNTPPPAFLALSMVDQHGHPFGGHRYVVTTPDGGERTGTLDAEGNARLEGIQLGTCHVSFPDLAPDDWGPA